MSRNFIYLGVVVLLAALAGYLFMTKPARRGLDVQGGLRLTLRAEIEKLSPEERKLWSPERMRTIIDILDRRIDSLGVIEPTIYQKGETEIVIELPGFTDERDALDLLQTTARLEFRYLKDVRTRKQPLGRYELIVEQVGGEDVVKFRDLTSADAKLIEPGMPEYQKIIQSSPLIVTGDDLERAEVVDQSFDPKVRLFFNSEGTEKFARATSLYLREHIAILLDNKIISAPEVQAANIRDPVIEGRFTLKQAARLRDLLNAGALPVSLSVESINRVEAILGAQAWDRIIQAGIIGFALVAVFMVFYYLLPGFLSALALGLYVLFALATFKAAGVTFSLPAIAGFILSIGMAIDANILIFERLKEELRLGKTLLAALDAAFKRAFPAIFDSNLSTIIICLILYYFGTGPVQGFATTLGIGVTMSFFTAIFCTRTMLYTLVGVGVHPSERLFGLRRQLGQEVGEQLGAAKDRFDFVNKRGLYYAISGAAILIGLVFWVGLGGLKPGIDFAGGSELVLQKRVPRASSPAPATPPANPQGNQATNPQGNQPAAAQPANPQGDQTANPQGNQPAAAQPANPQGNQPAAEPNRPTAAAQPNAGQNNPSPAELPKPPAQAQRPAAPAVPVSALPPIEANLAQVLGLLRGAGFEKVGALFAEGNRQLIVHVADANIDSQKKIVDALKPLGELEVVSFASVSPRVRAETVQRAITAVLVALVAILLYIALRFSIEGGWSGFKFGIAATIALAHDVLVMVGGAAILGYLLGWEINALFITALLTLVGFSINDTIVVYDRVRENLRQRARGETFATIVNRSLNQTLARSINTSLTLLLVLIALVIWGAVTQDLRFFYVAMLIGVVAGTYSSIFVASQIMVSWQDAREKLHQRQVEAARATAIPTKSGQPTSSATPTESATPPATASSAPRKKHHAPHVGKRKRRY
ncbi:MAG: protein translocase subunit SecD [Fimbriimonadales bacterium]|nr:protein translocase subunit SecD [Fimbriimonadales bacterium]